MDQLNLTLSEIAKNTDTVLAPTFTKSRIVLGDGFEIDVPDRLQNLPLISAIVKYYNSPWIAQQDFTKGTKIKKIKSLDLLFNKALKDFDYIPDTLPIRWLDSIKSVTDSRSESRTINFGISTALRDIFESRITGLKFTDEEYKAVGFFNGIWTNIPWVAPDKTKSLEDLTPLEYSNSELISGLRYFCSNHIKQWVDIIECFNSSSKLSSLKKCVLEDLKSFGVSSIYHKECREYANKSKKTYLEEIKPHEGKPTYKIWLELLKVCHSDLLVDMIFQCIVRRNKGIDETVSFNEETKVVKITNLELDKRKFCIKVLERKSNYKLPVLPPITSLLSPSIDMQLCIAWLLASDRHQTSNLVRMRTNSLQKFENSISTILKVESYKGRHKKVAGKSINLSLPEDEKAGETYKRNHPIYKAIDQYLELVKIAYKTNALVSNPELENQLLLPFIPNTNEGKAIRLPRYSTSSITSFSWALRINDERILSLIACLTEGTDTYEALINSPAKPFVDFFKYILEKNQNEPTINNKYKPKGIAISPNFIGQSAILAVDNEAYDITRSNNMEIAHYHDDVMSETIDAQSRHHTLETEKNVYIDRSGDRIKLENESRFALLVGEEMVNAAMEVTFERYKNTDLKISYGEAAIAMGMPLDQVNYDTYDLNDFLNSSEAMDYTLDKTGIVSNEEGKTVVVKTPIVAALIQGYIKHIDNSLERLIASNEKRIFSVITHRMFLQQIINNFDEKTKRLADELYGDAQFTFPEITV